MANPKKALAVLVILLVPSWILYGMSKEARYEAVASCSAIQPAVVLEKPALRHVSPALPASPSPRATDAVKTVRMLVTAYCICEICCEGWSKFARTATGKDARICDGVAADKTLLPYHTKLEIPGVGLREVDDTGGRMRQDAKHGIVHIDVRMASHQAARKFGVQWLDVKVFSK